MMGNGISLTALLALLLNLIGGLAALAGMILVGFCGGVDLAGLGDGRSFGYLLVCVGLCLVFGAVLLTRLARHRDMPESQG